MSQEKVAKYKEAKANRKKTMKKEKMKKIAGSALVILLVVALFGWIGYSAVDYYIQTRPRETVEVDYTALDDYATEIAE